MAKKVIRKKTTKIKKKKSAAKKSSAVVAKKSSQSPDSYVATLPDDRRAAFTKLRKLIRSSLPKGIVETFNWGMISYEVPLEAFPKTYNGKPLMFAALGSQKNHMAFYFTPFTLDSSLEKKLRAQSEANGKKVDLGKSCLRFTSLGELDLAALKSAIASMPLAKFIELSSK